jgi:phage tail protein X
MPARYVTAEGDMVDLVVLDYYGSRKGTTELVLEANKGLELHPPILPAGVEILLPDIDIQTVKTTSKRLKLWD